MISWCNTVINQMWWLSICVRMCRVAPLQSIIIKIIRWSMNIVQLLNLTSVWTLYHSTILYNIQLQYMYIHNTLTCKKIHNIIHTMMRFEKLIFCKLYIPWTCSTMEWLCHLHESEFWALIISFKVNFEL